MDAVKFLEELARMVTNGNKIETVTDFYITVETKHPAFGDRKYSFAACKDTVSGVERWSEAHPQKTRLQDFLEKYPNASLQEDGMPKSCGALLGYCKNCEESKNNCKTCWNQPIE